MIIIHTYISICVYSVVIINNGLVIISKQQLTPTCGLWGQTESQGEFFKY